MSEMIVYRKCGTLINANVSFNGQDEFTLDGKTYHRSDLVTKRTYHHGTIIILPETTTPKGTNN